MEKPLTNSTKNSKIIKASRETIYEALTDPAALSVWLAPGVMTGKVHSFDLRVGGGYQMSLFYPKSEKENCGKTSTKEDKFTARFIELVPPEKVVELITFDSSDPAFAGEMTLKVTLELTDNGTKVIFLFNNIPPGIRPEDNEAGTELSLEKLARFVE